MPLPGPPAGAEFFDNPGLFGEKLNYLFTFAEIIRVLPSHMTGICSDLFGFTRDLVLIWRYLNSAFIYLKDFHIR